MKRPMPEYKNIGLMAVADCPVTTASAVKLSRLVDYIVFRYDVVNGNKRNGEGGKFHSALFRQSNLFDIPVEHFDATTGYSGGTFWREEMLERINHLEPELVFLFDSDEIISDEKQLLDDIERFRQSNDDYLMFNYRMASSDGRNIPQTPTAPHCKIFKWMPGISFYQKSPDYGGGKGFGKPHLPKRRCTAMIADTVMDHYSMFTPDMQEDKLSWYCSFKSPGGVNRMFDAGNIEGFNEYWIEHNKPEKYWDSDYVKAKDREKWRYNDIGIASKILYDKFSDVESVVDFGAANGLYLLPFWSEGKTVLGIEGTKYWLEPMERTIGEENCMRHDLREQLDLNRKFDLGISFETLEHIEHYFAEIAVQNIVRHSKTMLITASPRKGGMRHLNVKPKQYWIDLFEKSGAKYDKERSEELMGLFKDFDTRMKWLKDGIMIYESC